jgi:hypothetical protein
MEDDDLESLRAAFVRLYDQLPWIMRGTSAGARQTHTCSQRCQFIDEGNVHLCMLTGNVHMCTEMLCDQLVHTSEKKVCMFTGRDYDLDEGVVFGYDNADRGNREFIHGYQTVADVQRTEKMHYAVGAGAGPSASARPVVPQLKRRKQHRLHAPQPAPQIHATAAVPATAAATAAATARPAETARSIAAALKSETDSWACTVHPPKKKRCLTLSESRDSDHHAVHAQACSLMESMGVKDARLVQTVARACQHTWAQIATTALFATEKNKYKPLYHIAVVMRFMQVAGLNCGGREFAPHTPQLSEYLSGPKDFALAPFRIPSSKFTSCSTTLRKCISEKHATLGAYPRSRPHPHPHPHNRARH